MFLQLLTFFIFSNGNGLIFLFYIKKYTTEDNRFIRDRKMTQKNICIYSYSKKLYSIYGIDKVFHNHAVDDFQTI